MTSSLKFILICISYRDNIIKWKLQKDTKSIKMKFIFGKNYKYGKDLLYIMTITISDNEL
jgi:hypothetical protein